MRFLIDEDLPVATACEPVSLGHEALHVRDIGLGGQSDEAVLAEAQRLEAVLVTADREFGNVHRYPPGSHCGIVLLRFPDYFRRTDILGLLRQCLEMVPANSMRGVLVVARPGSVRIRR